MIKENHPWLKFIPLKVYSTNLNIFKQLSYYNIVDAYIKDPEDRALAMLCCQSVEDENKCYNFSKTPSTSEPIIMGFNEKESIGHIKEVNVYSRNEEVIIQQKEIYDILESNNIFKSFKRS